MSEYHEPEAELSALTRDFHRALRSLGEEIEAVDWYQQRFDTCGDATLRAVLGHNRDEEMEHACMVLEWLRRTMPGWDTNLRKYLFTEGPVTAIEGGAEKPGATSAPPQRAGDGEGDLGIGSLRSAP